MAAAVSSVWSKPGAWALESEQHEEAELKQQSLASSKQTTVAGGGDSADFPSLAAAATTKTKKKKGQTISLAEFAAYGTAKAAPTPQTERLTQAELVSLPTGPRERSAEELDRSKLGGGFRSYGSGNRYGDDSSNNSRWGSSSRVSEDGERRGGLGFNRESGGRDSGPSRADENDNWAAAKKPLGGNGFDRRDRIGGGGSGGGGGFFESQSKADEVDSWVSTKPSSEPPRRFGGGGSGGGGDRFEKRGSFESLSRTRDTQFGGGSDSDTWGRRREDNGGGDNNGVQPPPSLGGGGSRPRLVLQPRTLPVTVMEVKPVVEVKPESPVFVIVDKPKGANPFGNARPREEVLAEKGQDWKEIEEKLEAEKLKDVVAAVEKPDERSQGKIGFGLGNGVRKDDRTERSWRKSEESEVGAEQEAPPNEEEEPNKEEETIIKEEDGKTEN
ncbi:unnamed protein product [Cochlearia groenlandica]